MKSETRFRIYQRKNTNVYLVSFIVFDSNVVDSTGHAFGIWIYGCRLFYIKERVPIVLKVSESLGEKAIPQRSMGLCTL